MNQPGLVRDDYAGPGGWSVGLRMLGLHDVGVEWDAAACATRAAAGLPTIRADLATYRPDHRGGVWGYIASPPCQTFSAAGKGEGIAHLTAIVQAIHDENWAAADQLDPRTRHVIDAARNACTLDAEWVCLEQVPALLPVWRAIAERLRARGYSTWCGVLNAADYGVPQTRKRALLIASRARSVTIPPPTHAKTPTADLFGPPLERWVTMAEALGWTGPNTDTPARTLCGARTPRWLYDDPDGTRGRTVGFPRRNDRDDDTDDGYRARDWSDPDDAPAQTITGRARSMVVRTGQQTSRHGREPEDSEPYERSVDEPAPTVMGSAGGWKVYTGRRWVPGGSYSDAQTVDADSQPAQTITGGSGGQWQLRPGDDWPYKRPATTLCSSNPGVVAPTGGGADVSMSQRGYFPWGEDDPRSWAEHRPATTIVGTVGDPPRQDTPGAIKITLQDALMLQSFHPDHPVAGSRTKQFEQVGNAVPPLLAAHVVAMAVGAGPVTDI